MDFGKLQKAEMGKGPPSPIQKIIQIILICTPPKISNHTLESTPIFQKSTPIFMWAHQFFFWERGRRLPVKPMVAVSEGGFSSEKITDTWRLTPRPTTS